MIRRAGLIQICVTGALVAGVCWSSTGALAQTMTSLANPTQNSTSKKADQANAKAKPKHVAKDAMAKADPVPFWWFHGTVEVGGRFFINNPQNGHQTANGPPGGFPGKAGKSLGGYYEYTGIAPGAFSNIDLATGSKDGLYEVDLGGHNIAYNDQSYYLNYSEVGKQYFTFEWDQTPHIYSESAYTPYLVNGNALTLSAACTGATTVQALALCAHPTNIGIERDTAHVHYRWTPDDAWDINVDYSHMSRTGTQVSAVEGNGFTPGPEQITKPVDDTTQNYNVNGEYVGSSPWGQKIIFKAGYLGSQYHDDYANYTVQSPGGGTNAMFSNWPSNQANGFDSTLAAWLPWNSRYTSTVNYTVMTQNQAFNSAYGAVVLSQGGVPQSSLNGEIDTLLVNNILTTKVTSDLTSKLSYRYYDFDNKTPEMFLNPAPEFFGGGVTTNTISMGYTKQNAAEELNWRPSREWNWGGILGFERYDWTRADANVTNEITGKLYGDWKPNSWFGLRSSVYYGDRGYQNYNYLAYVGAFQWPGAGCGAAPTNCATQYQSTYRQLMIDNRQVWKANVSTDIVVVNGLTITPNFKYENDSYGVDPANQQGLQNANKWTAGLDATYLINPATSIMVGYTFDYGKERLYGIDCTGNSTTCPSTGAQTITNDTTHVHTITALLRYAAIPDKLDTSLRYTASYGTDNMTFVDTGAAANNTVFPENNTWYQRVDATATYTFDKDQIKQLGWNGTVKAKLHYAWERNAETNWANDPLTPYTTMANLNTTLWLAWYNPNYNVHMIMASLAFGW
jgi:MtrB/PioB family decaheme-associated outer membrane protein